LLKGGIRTFILTGMQNFKKGGGNLKRNKKVQQEFREQG